jgi:thiol-disulfide isomerase/thioredoxin
MEASMKRATPMIVMALFVSLIPVASPCLAQSCGDLEAKLAELARRVESLEQRLGAAAATAAPSRPPAAPPAPAAGGREAALALYKKVDGLIARGELEQAKGELSAWDAKYAGTPDAAWTRALNREVAVVGKAAPTDWSIDHWYQGEADIALDGRKPTLVVFWEAWCPHCRDEVPKLEKLWDEYRGKGLQVVGVTRITQSATEDSVKEFIAGSGVSYPMAKETGELATYFDVKGIPAVAMVKDGKVVWRGHPMRLDDELLRAWF